VTLTLVAPVEPSRVLYEPLNQDSPVDCRRCGSPMRREMGPRDDPDAAGRLVQETWDVCLTRGTSWLVVDETGPTPQEWRERVRRVKEHKRVRDHSNCGPDEPCRAKRPGLPAPGPISPKEGQ
jgi:hypothetical protein